MTKNLIAYLSLATINLFIITKCLGQQSGYVDDYRIVKHEKEIVQYLIKKKVLDANVSFDFKEFDFKIDVVKCLELYSDTSKLLVRFGKSGDHDTRFWGLLSDKKEYFFLDPDDLTDADVLAFEKQCDTMTVSIIKYYCYLSPPEDAGFIPKASWVYGQNLSVIKDALYNKIGLTAAKINSAVSFLNGTTGIKPHSNKDRFGRYNLNQEDYTQWLNWLRMNGSKLYWDKKEQKVKVK